MCQHMEGGGERERDALGHNEKLISVKGRLGIGFEESFDSLEVGEFGKYRVLFPELVCDGRVSRIERTLNFLSWSRLMRTAFVLPYLEKKLSNLDCSVGSSSGKPFWIAFIVKKE